MSNTPRVDEELQRLNDAIRAGEECDDVAEAYAWEFARQLERELAEARAEIESKDRLIEQMREALIVADSLVTSLIDTHVDKCASIYDFDRDIIKAALRAADGGE